MPITIADLESILEHIFNNKELADISEERIAELAKQYPYFPNAHIWLTKKYAETAPEKYPAHLSKTNIYAGERYILQQYLENKNEPPVAPATPPAIDEAVPPITEVHTSADEQPEESITEEILPAHEETAEEMTVQQEPDSEITTEENPLEARIAEKLTQELSSLAATPEEELIRPLYAEDYFASQGIKLPEIIDDTKKPTADQLRSFTDWLRATRRPGGSKDPDNPDEENENSTDTLPPGGAVASAVKKMASDSIASNETIITEAMANVRILQGQYDKAIAIYEKLSLLNPEKSDYFVQKIQKLKK